jgi:hypothetical protein
MKSSDIGPIPLSGKATYRELATRTTGPVHKSQEFTGASNAGSLAVILFSFVAVGN